MWDITKLASVRYERSNICTVLLYHSSLFFSTDFDVITATKGKPLKVFSGESEAVEKQLQNSKIPYSQLITVQNNRSLQTAYIAYTKDKQKLTEALNNSGFTAIEDVDSFMSDYDKVMIRVAENISQRHLFDSIGLW